MNVDDGETTRVSSFEMLGHVGVSFPQSDVAEMTRRMITHNAGQQVGPGQVDWSSVEIELDDIR